MYFKLILWLFLSLASCQEAPAWMPGSGQSDDHGTTTNLPPSAPEVSDSALPEDPIYKAAITNLDYLKASVNLEPWLKRGHHGERLTIAILDNGFGGLNHRLPIERKAEA